MTGPIGADLSSVDPFSAVGAGERMAAYAELAEGGPVRRMMLPGGTPVWLITGYDEARAAINNDRLVKGPSPMRPVAFRMRPDLAPALYDHMLATDGEDHARLRRLVNAAFTRRRVEALAPRVQLIADSLLDAMDKARADDQAVDLITAYAFPLPMTVICELLDVPEADREPFRRLTHAVLGGRFDTDEAFAAVLDELVPLLRAWISAKRAEPGDDLLSALVAARDGSDRLSEDELTSMTFLLVAAGHETTVNLLASGMRALLADPHQCARLQADPDLGPTAVEELLRFESPLQVAFPLVATEPLTIGQAQVAAGEMVLPALLAANRDPAYFPDPAVLDVGRTPNAHLAFGHGAHHCLGAPLARLEARIALNALLKRFPQMTLAVDPAELTWTPNVLIHGLTALPVRLG